MKTFSCNKMHQYKEELDLLKWMYMYANINNIKIRISRKFQIIQRSRANALHCTEKMSEISCFKNSSGILFQYFTVWYTLYNLGVWEFSRLWLTYYKIIQAPLNVVLLLRYGYKNMYFVSNRQCHRKGSLLV